MLRCTLSVGRGAMLLHRRTPLFRRALRIARTCARRRLLDALLGRPVLRRYPLLLRPLLLCAIVRGLLLAGPRLLRCWRA